MSAAAVGRRMLAQGADVDHAALGDGRLDSAERARVADALATFQGWPLTLADQPRLTPAQLRGWSSAPSRNGAVTWCVWTISSLWPRPIT